MADILVVDDDEDLAALVAQFLTDEGHSVRVAHDGELGLARLTQELPQLVIMDIEMPLLSGPGMATRMFVENLGKENVPIVIVSGSEELPSIAAQLGTPYSLAKPFSPEALLALVDRALREGALPRPSL